MSDPQVPFHVGGGVYYVDRFNQPEDLVGYVHVVDEMKGIIDPYPGGLIMKYNLTLFMGNNKVYRVYVRDRDLNPIDVTGGIGVMTVKATTADTAVITKRTDNPSQGTIGSPDMGEILFIIVPADTSSLAERQYVFDVKFKTSSGSTYTVVEGILNLKKPVNQTAI